MATTTNRLVIWDLKSGQIAEKKDLSNGTSSKPEVTVFGENRLFFTDGRNGYLRETIRGTEKKLPADFSRISSFSFNRDASNLVTSNYDGQVNLWDTRTGNSLTRLWFGNHLADVPSVTITPDGSKVLVTTNLSPTAILTTTSVAQDLKVAIAQLPANAPVSAEAKAEIKVLLNAMKKNVRASIAEVLQIVNRSAGPGAHSEIAQLAFQAYSN